MEKEIFKINDGFTEAQKVMAETINDLYKSNKICMISDSLKIELLNLWASNEQYFAQGLSRLTANISKNEIDIIKNLHSSPTGLKNGQTISRRIISIFVNRSEQTVADIIENRRGVNKIIQKIKPRQFRGIRKNWRKRKFTAPLNPSDSQNNLINFNFNIINNQNPVITNFQQSSVSAQNSFFVQSSNQAFTLQQPIQNSLFIQNPQNFSQLQNQDIQQNNHQIQTELPEDLMQENFDLYNQQEQHDPSFFGPNENFPFF